MLRRVYFLLFIVCVAFSLVSVDSAKTTSEAAPTTSTVAPTPTIITTTTSTPPTTTVAPTTTTTTTAAPTTAAPSTTTAAPSTTTAAPSTTLSPISTTAKPESDRWVVKDNGTTCIIAMMKIKFEIPYNDSKEAPAMGRLEVPESADSSGSSCNATDPTVPQILLLHWTSSNNTSNATNWVKFTFRANSNNKTDNMYQHYWLAEVEAMLNVNDSRAFPNKTGNFNMVDAMNDTIRFEAPLGYSYSCGPASSTPLTIKPPMVANMKGHVVLADVQLQAFRNSPDTNFSDSIVCENSDTPDLVPILVGTFLIILVVCVLVAYIITRRRAMARGYLSM